jgi:acetylornithine deacetylase/succinyl-diaminopimelate desuccinylase-like protein
MPPTCDVFKRLAKDSGNNVLIGNLCYSLAGCVLGMKARIMNEIEEEVASLLSDLIQIDTTNPPGKETEAAKYIAGSLGTEGFVCEVLESLPGRGSTVTRLKGTGQKPSLLLLSHLDVVAANAAEWTVDPFGGVIQDGFVWGRGALDMKSMTAIETMVMKLLKRNGVKLKGDVILAATADEEKGGEAGARWLVDNHLEKVHADYVLNEGGGMGMSLDGNCIYTINTAEKGMLWFRVKAKGKPGHGSIPSAADNAILRMNKIIDRLGNYRAEIMVVPVMNQFLRDAGKESKLMNQSASILLREPDKADQILDVLAQRDKVIAEELRASLRMTVAPTIVHGGVKENIIPSECETVFDCRLLPGQSPESALANLKRLIQDVGLDRLDFEVIQASEPSESVMNTALYELIVKVLREFEPDCSVAPRLMTGGTDSRFFRKNGSVCYGFHPVRPDIPYGEMVKTVHGIDERISVKNLVFGTSVLYNIVERFMS